MVEFIVASAVVLAVTTLLGAALDALDPARMDMLAAAWPWLWLTVLAAVAFGKFLLGINRHWWSLSVEERQAQRDSDDFGW